MRALETEAGVQTEDLGEDASFLRALVLDGRWEDAITLIEVCVYVYMYQVCTYVCMYVCMRS